MDHTYPFVPGDLIVTRCSTTIWVRPHESGRPEEGEVIDPRQGDVLTVIATGDLDVDPAWRWYVVLHCKTLAYGWVRIRTVKSPRNFTKLAFNPA